MDAACAAVLRAAFRRPRFLLPGLLKTLSLEVAPPTGTAAAAAARFALLDKGPAVAMAVAPAVGQKRSRATAAAAAGAGSASAVLDPQRSAGRVGSAETTAAAGQAAPAPLRLHMRVVGTSLVDDPHYAAPLLSPGALVLPLRSPTAASTPHRRRGVGAEGADSGGEAPLSLTPTPLPPMLALPLLLQRSRTSRCCAPPACGAGT